ncbi:MAG TPA: hypothetical protein VJ982_10930, partial [Gemmatimonadota bacterium]|nr:hypothetical protein [Gemmatimonadota bacterium]
MSAPADERRAVDGPRRSPWVAIDRSTDSSLAMRVAGAPAAPAAGAALCAAIVCGYAGAAP